MKSIENIVDNFKIEKLKLKHILICSTCYTYTLIYKKKEENDAEWSILIVFWGFFYQKFQIHPSEKMLCTVYN